MQTEIIEQIIHLPIYERIEIIEEISRSVREDMREKDGKYSHKEQTSIEERKAAYLQLRGVAKMENPPMTKEETREDYYNFLAEKYK